jgi:hypothetical protein
MNVLLVRYSADVAQRVGMSGLSSLSSLPKLRNLKRLFRFCLYLESLLLYFQMRPLNHFGHAQIFRICQLPCCEIKGRRLNFQF